MPRKNGVNECTTTCVCALGVLKITKRNDSLYGYTQGSFIIIHFGIHGILLGHFCALGKRVESATFDKEMTGSCNEQFQIAFVDKVTRIKELADHHARLPSTAIVMDGPRKI